MKQSVLRECDMSVFGSIGPFDDELIVGDMAAAINRIEACETPLAAVQLVLATFCRSDSVISEEELDRLAQAVGVFEDEP